MLSKWYGEFEWDNFTVKFHSHRGQKTGVVIEYGKNLTALEQDEDNSGVYTALLSYAVYTPEGSDTETVVTLPEVTLPRSLFVPPIAYHAGHAAVNINASRFTLPRIFLRSAER